MIKTKPEIVAKRKPTFKQEVYTTLEVAALAIVSAILVAFIYFAVAHANPYPVQSTKTVEIADDVEPSPVRENKVKRTVIRQITAKVTGYNTVPEQTDSRPCEASSGENICGKKNVVACPRALPSKTIVEIHGKEYVCLDVLAEKFDHRFDISCDKDFNCPYKVTGTTTVKIIAYETK